MTQQHTLSMLHRQKKNIAQIHSNFCHQRSDNMLHSSSQKKTSRGKQDFCALSAELLYMPKAAKHKVC
jgi:hypothetical protein